MDSGEGRMTLRLRITITLLDLDDEAMRRAARRLILMLAAELVRAGAKLEEDDL
jgi:hypothetical protein